MKGFKRICTSLAIDNPEETAELWSLGYQHCAKEVMFLVQIVCQSVFLSAGLLKPYWPTFQEMQCSSGKEAKEEVIAFWSGLPLGQTSVF